ncbi:MAG: helix-turn-helix domain-containing protein [Acidimicrobiales bacterium]
MDVVETIGQALADVSSGVSIGWAARWLDVPFTTVRGWVRRFTARASLLWSGFAALTVELGGTIPARWPSGLSAAAIAAMGWAHRAAFARHEMRTGLLWAFVSVVCGGELITTNTDPPWRVFGNRRFIPPSPFGGVLDKGTDDEQRDM